MTRTRPLYFVVNAVLFAVFTIAAWLAPTMLAGPLEISLTTPTALADFRAVYGGLSFAIAGLSLLALRKAEFRLPVLWLLALCMAGLLTGRLISTVVSGPGSFVIFAQLALEIVSAAWGLALIRAHAQPATS